MQTYLSASGRKLFNSENAEAVTLFTKFRIFYYKRWFGAKYVISLEATLKFNCPVGIYLLKVNNKNTRIKCEIC